MGVFGDNTKFNACALELYMLLLVAYRFTKGETYLFSDEVGMFSIPVTYSRRDIIFNLDPGVDFKEIGLTIAGNDPFPGPDIVIPDM